MPFTLRTYEGKPPHPQIVLNNLLELLECANSVIESQKILTNLQNVLCSGKHLNKYNQIFLLLILLTAVLLRVFDKMVHMWRISTRRKNNRQCFQIDLPFTRAHLLTSAPTSFFQHTLGTAELIQSLLNSISWKETIFSTGVRNQICFLLGCHQLEFSLLKCQVTEKRKKKPYIKCVHNFKSHLDF